MKLRKGITSAVQAVIGILIKPYAVFTTGNQSQLTVSTTETPPTTIMQGLSIGNAALVTVRNVSTGNQIIRVGPAPKFSGTPAGIELWPGDSYTWANVSTFLGAVASANGGLLDREVLTVQ
jgi:hypothetical protein